MRQNRAVPSCERWRSRALPIALVLGLSGLPAAAPVEAGIFTVNTPTFVSSYEVDADGSALSLAEALRLANGIPLGGGRPTLSGFDCLDNGEKLQIDPQGGWSGFSTCWTLATSPSGAIYVDTIQFAVPYTIPVTSTELLGDGDQILGNTAILTSGGSPIGLQLAGPGSVGTGSQVKNLRFQNFTNAGILCDGCQKVGFYGLTLRNNSTGLLARPNTVALRNPDHLKIGSLAAGINLVYSNTGDGIRIVADPAYTFPADFDIEIQSNKFGDDGTVNDVGNGGDGIELQNIRLAEIGGADAGEGNLINFNNGYGIRIGGDSADSNVVEANYIGLDGTGLIARSNSAGGVSLESGAGENVIRGNRIAGNGGPGVSVAGEESDGNLIRANRIGTTADGLLARPNEVAGVRIAGGADFTEVGEFMVPASGNLVSGNNGWGVGVLGDGTTGTEICENFIGTNAAGTAAVPNASDGVRIQEQATGALVRANLISGNGEAGVGLKHLGTTGHAMVENRIGTNSAMNAAISNATYGFVLAEESGGNTLIANIIAGNGLASILIDNSDTNLVDTNTVGISGLSSPYGIVLLGGAQGNDIAGNAIGGHSFAGVALSGDGTSLNDVYRNWIGTNSDGDAANPNGLGVAVVEGASGNTIGGADDTFGNVISGNTGNGVEVMGAGTSSNTVRFNLIGTDSSGGAALGNGADGVQTGAGASGNWFVENVVSGNTLNGFRVLGAGTTAALQRNHIGVGSDPADSVPNGWNGVHVSGAEGPVNLGASDPSDENLIAHNGLAGLRIEGATTTLLNGQDLFWANGGLAIDLGTSGVTANDLLDADGGPNGTLNMPVIRSARVTDGTLTAEIKYHGEPSTTLRIYLYANSSCDASRHGEGETAIVQQTVVTDANGNGETTISTPGVVGEVLSALAAPDLDPVVSEFSTCRAAVAGTSSLIFDDSFESGLFDAWSGWTP